MPCKLSRENIISSPPENSDMGNDTLTEDNCTEDIPKHVQNVHQPLEDQENPSALTAQTDIGPDDDTYRSRLRQRSVNEGGYIRLHKGMEKNCRNGRPFPSQRFNRWPRNWFKEEKDETAKKGCQREH